METKEYGGMDKSHWPRGPWDAEPDKVQWQDEATGLPCLIVRNGSGSLCGYVGVPPGHLAYGKDYGTGALDVDVHGGLTFASQCADQSREAWERWRKHALARKPEAEQYPNGDAAQLFREHADAIESFDVWSKWSEASHVCHVPGPGEPDSVWWLGFDCAHSGDMTPSYADRMPSFGGERATYRDIGYVRKQVAGLARQLHAMVPA
jgi:hypothetical protein